MALQIKPSPLAFATTRFTTTIGRRVLTYVRRHHIIKPGERVVVGVSGGPDSTALLIILSRLARKLKLDITVAHFSHKLRTPEDATADLDFVRALSLSLNLPLVHSSGDTRGYATEHHASLEDAARRLRYAFLAAESSAVGASAVVVGHTLDDQAETVLLHLSRGAGLAGVRGMSRRTPWPIDHGPELARPLLLLRREDTERYCREARRHTAKGSDERHARRDTQ